MTQAYGLAEVQESEGADLGAVSLAGVRRACASCGRDSWTGDTCTACTFAGAPEIPPMHPYEGVRPRGPENRSERAEGVAPEFAHTIGCLCPAPGPVFELEALAAAEGWAVMTRHSRGTPAGARTVKDVWSVRFRRRDEWGAWMGYAVRAGESWNSVCIAGDSLPPFLAAGVTELREWLQQPAREEQWYAGIRQRRAAQELAAKVVRCPGPGECWWSAAFLLAAHRRPWPLARFLVEVGSGDHSHRADGSIKIKRSRAERVDGG